MTQLTPEAFARNRAATRTAWATVAVIVLIPTLTGGWLLEQTGLVVGLIIALIVLLVIPNIFGMLFVSLTKNQSAVIIDGLSQSHLSQLELKQRHAVVRARSREIQTGFYGIRIGESVLKVIDFGNAAIVEFKVAHNSSDGVKMTVEGNFNWLPIRGYSIEFACTNDEVITNKFRSHIEQFITGWISANPREVVINNVKKLTMDSLDEFAGDDLCDLEELYGAEVVSLNITSVQQPAEFDKITQARLTTDQLVATMGALSALPIAENMDPDMLLLQAKDVLGIGKSEIFFIGGLRGNQVSDGLIEQAIRRSGRGGGEGGGKGAKK